MKKIALTTYFIVIASLVAIPFIEKETGNHHLYSSWWFICLWVILTIAGILLLFNQKKKGLSVKLLLYGSLVLLFSGALITHFCEKQGFIHLRQGYWMSEYYDRENDMMYSLPFKVRLDTFLIQYYPGTEAPADYISKISIVGEKSYKAVISVNKLLKEDGFRFYQSNFDRDGRGTVLMVNYNPAGIGVTYVGYILLFLSLLLLLFHPDAPFRKLLNYPFIKATCLFLFFSVVSFTNCQASKTLSQKEAAQFSELLILHNNRIMPFQTFAIDFTQKLTGETSYKGYSPEQVVLGWIFYPEEWQYEPMIKVKGKELRKVLLRGKYACFVDFFDKSGNYKLSTTEMFSADKNVREADEKVQLIAMLQSGNILKLFPYRQNNHVKWYAPLDSLPTTIGESEKIFIRNSLFLIYDAANHGNTEYVSFVVKGIKQYQIRVGSDVLPSETMIKGELLYNRIHFFEILYKLNLSFGLLTLFLFFFRFKAKAIYLYKHSWIFIFVMVILFLFLTGCIVLRTFVSGHFPLSNGYETMLFVSWCIMFITLLFSFKLLVLLPFGFLLSGFTMLVASIGELNSQITPLVPVLDSPLLSIHVSLLMLSYALLAFTFLLSLYAIIHFLIFRLKNSYSAIREIVQFALQMRLILYPAIILLAIGIMTGSVWANVSWGNYWSWDPKEVWALITLMAYSLGLPLSPFGILRKPVAYHLFIMLAFTTVLMTYFGVSFLLGGMHSYGG